MKVFEENNPGFFSIMDFSGLKVQSAVFNAASKGSARSHLRNKGLI